MSATLAPPAPAPVRSRPAERTTVAIVGGGVAGLSAALALHRAGVAFRLLEAGPRFGGVLHTERADGFLLEAGPDNVIDAKPAWREMASALGLAGQVITPNARERALWLLRRGRLRRFPEGMALAVPTRLLPFALSRFFSIRGKARMALEPFLAPAKGGDESVAGFLRRRLGAEAAERVGQPLLAGIHAADAERLSMRSAFPLLWEMEARHGSLLRAARRAPRGPAASSPFRALEGGMSELVRALVGALPPDHLRLGAAVSAVRRDANGWAVAAGGATLRADAVILAVPPRLAGRLLEGASSAAPMLRALPAVSTAVVHLGFRRSDVRHPLDGHGLVAAPAPGHHVTACSFASTKYAGRAPEGHVLLRAFVGGALDEAVLDLDDEALVDRVVRDLDGPLGFRRWPVLQRVHRWPSAMPQMEVGHAARVARIEDALADAPGVFLAGAGLRVTGVPDAIGEGLRAASLAAAHAVA